MGQSASDLELRPRVQITSLKARLIPFLPTSFISMYSQSKGRAVTFRMFSLSLMIDTERTGRHSSGLVTLQLLLQSGREEKKNQIKEKSRSESGILTEREQKNQQQEKITAN